MMRYRFFSERLRGFMAHLRRRGLAERSAYLYALHVRGYQRWGGGARAGYLAHLEAQGRAATTRRRAEAALAHFALWEAAAGRRLA